MRNPGAKYHTSRLYFNQKFVGSLFLKDDLSKILSEPLSVLYEKPLCKIWCFYTLWLILCVVLESEIFMPIILFSQGMICQKSYPNDNLCFLGKPCTKFPCFRPTSLGFSFSQKLLPLLTFIGVTYKNPFSAHLCYIRYPYEECHDSSLTCWDCTLSLTSVIQC